MVEHSARVIIIHGSYGNPDGNWFPWLKHRVETLGNVALVPRFPTPEGQSLVSWTDVFYSNTGHLTPETILVGHSLGAGFVLTLLEESHVEIRATFLIAGFLGKLGLPNYDRINATFVCKDFNWPAIKNNAGTIFVLNGDNDPYVPLAKGQEIADALAVPLHLVPGGGHLNAESGYTAFPLLESKIAPFLAPYPTQRSPS